MPRTRELMVMLILYSIAILTSGCYTIVGYPPLEEKSVIEEESVVEPVYSHYGYYRSYPYSYYRDYFDPYYGLLSPYYYYDYYDYWDYPRWYSGDYYRYYYRDYDYYVPQSKPETRYRGSSRRRDSRPESDRQIRIEEGEEKKQLNRKIRSGPRPENRTQSPARKNRSPVSSSKKRAAKRESQDEDEE